MSQRIKSENENANIKLERMRCSSSEERLKKLKFEIVRKMVYLQGGLYSLQSHCAVHCYKLQQF